MDLSVVIVNYNVKYFLEQCLHSVYKAQHNLTMEVIVVDNNSVDGSRQMLQEKFPDVQLISNRKNVGFSRANNQGFKVARGKYILILNPDTIVQEDTFTLCQDFMESHPDAGALGVKMIDGKGNFLPESKRSLPTPSVSFYKVFGLSALFPRSKIFGRYHLGYLDREEVHSIEILPGAFMWVRKKTLEETGYFDETFFMYGEDIDLSYRILQAGYKNYYFPRTTIIHYKGESTKKGSINYVLVFYKAMIIFARKHFSRKNAWLFSLLINMAIYLRASISILRRILTGSVVPLADAILIYLGFSVIEPFWEVYKFGVRDYYPDEYMRFVVPVYVFIWFLFLFLSGAYEKRMRFLDVVKGIALGSLVILLVYALLPEHLRYSRALLLMGAVLALVAALLNRFVLGRLFGICRIQLSALRKRIAIVGSAEEKARVEEILRQVDLSPVFVGLITVDPAERGPQVIGHLAQINEIIKINRIEEIVFCARDIPSQEIISTMLRVANTDLEFKIAPPESLSIIGSNSINTTGEFYVVHFNALNMPSARRKKRLFDVLISMILLALAPLAIFTMRQPLGFLRNVLLVLMGFRSWVGFMRKDDSLIESLPRIRRGVLTPIPAGKKEKLSGETIRHFNLLYAKDYRIMNDLGIMYRDFRNLGTK